MTAFANAVLVDCLGFALLVLRLLEPIAVLREQGFLKSLTNGMNKKFVIALVQVYQAESADRKQCKESLMSNQ